MPSRSVSSETITSARDRPRLNPSNTVRALPLSPYTTTRTEFSALFRSGADSAFNGRFKSPLTGLSATISPLRKTAMLPKNPAVSDAICESARKRSALLVVVKLKSIYEPLATASSTVAAVAPVDTNSKNPAKSVVFNVAPSPAPNSIAEPETTSPVKLFSDNPPGKPIPSSSKRRSPVAKVTVEKGT